MATQHPEDVLILFIRLNIKTDGQQKMEIQNWDHDNIDLYIGVFHAVCDSFSFAGY